MFLSGYALWNRLLGYNWVTGFIRVLNFIFFFFFFSIFNLNNVFSLYLFCCCQFTRSYLFLQPFICFLVELLPSTYKLYLRSLYMEESFWPWTTYYLVKLARKHRECFSKRWYVDQTLTELNYVWPFCLIDCAFINESVATCSISQYREFSSVFSLIRTKKAWGLWNCAVFISLSIRSSTPIFFITNSHFDSLSGSDNKGLHPGRTAKALGEH